MSLASAGLAVREYGAVVAFQDSLDDWSSDHVVNVQLAGVIAEDVVEREGFRRLALVAAGIANTDHAFVFVNRNDFLVAVSLFSVVQGTASDADFNITSFSLSRINQSKSSAILIRGKEECCMFNEY